MQCRRCLTKLEAQVLISPEGLEQNIAICPACHLDSIGLRQGMDLEDWNFRANVWRILHESN